MCKATRGQILSQVGKIEILEKRLSPTAQNHKGWCHCKIHQKSYRKKTKAGVKFDPGWPFEG